tara:strand:+ start:1703 stop:2377 length:675 start_codon:yes stop_codon:yes gene_type:complete
MKKNIANFLTIINLLLGVLCIYQCFISNFVFSAFIIIACFFLDGIDGTIARFLKVDSEFGKQLDSFSDFVSFGLAPAFLIFLFFSSQFNNSLSYLFILIPVLSAIRLARYNINKKYVNKFLGLTTPANALLISSIVLIYYLDSNELFKNVVTNEYFIVILVFVSSLMLISNIETFEIRLDRIFIDQRKLFFIFISLTLLYIFSFSGMLMSLLFYITLSILKIIN